METSTPRVIAFPDDTVFAKNDLNSKTSLRLSKVLKLPSFSSDTQSRCTTTGSDSVGESSISSESVWRPSGPGVRSEWSEPALLLDHCYGGGDTQKLVEQHHKKIHAHEEDTPSVSTSLRLDIRSQSSFDNVTLLSSLLSEVDGSTEDDFFCRTPQQLGGFGPEVGPRSAEFNHVTSQSQNICDVPEKGKRSVLAKRSDSVGSLESGRSVNSSDADNDESKENEPATPSSRQSFRRYWKYAHRRFGTTISGMMLNEKAEAASFSEQERNEILEWISEALTNSVPVELFIEIGAGIGRLTPHLMKFSKKLIAVDFLEAYIRQNETAHRDPQRSDVFLCQDALTLEFGSKTVDVLFWNWFLMYLTDVEMRFFLHKALHWVKTGGYIFCRESCGSPSHAADRSWAREGNPTKYRRVHSYTQAFRDAAVQQGLQLDEVFVGREVAVYNKEYGTHSQRAWLFKRIE